MASVLLADDHAMLRSGVRRYLESDRSIDCIGETATGADTLQQLRSRPWDLLVLDINMPDRSGIDILRHIRSCHPTTRILVMSGFAEKQYAIIVLRAGASGYLAKDRGPEEFLRAVHTILAGRRFVSDGVREILVDALEAPSDQPLHTGLSERELQILCKLAVGRSVAEISQELFISAKTVSTYRARILEKMNLATNAELVSYAVRNGLVQ
jgi:two-component system, NarL family, invasion response regulator UvrY